MQDTGKHPTNHIAHRMDFIASPFGVLLILGLVAVTAVVYQPASDAGKWTLLTGWFGADREPSHTSFSGESIYVSGYAKCDVSLEARGMWIQREATDHPAPTCLFVPWHCMRLGKRNDVAWVFMLREELTEVSAQRSPKRIPQVNMTVSAELGTAMLRKIDATGESRA